MQTNASEITAAVRSLPTSYPLLYAVLALEIFFPVFVDCWNSYEVGRVRRAGNHKILETVFLVEASASVPLVPITIYTFYLLLFVCTSLKLALAQCCLMLATAGASYFITNFVSFDFKLLYTMANLKDRVNPIPDPVKKLKNLEGNIGISVFF